MTARPPPRGTVVGLCPPTASAAGRRASGLVTDAPNCTTFTRHVFNDGAFFGPVDICFRVSNSTPPFLLHWTPDLGAFCCQEDIKIWPT